MALAGIVSAMLGSIFITTLSSAMDLLEVGGYVRQIVLGRIIIGATFLDGARATSSGIGPRDCFCWSQS